MAPPLRLAIIGFAHMHVNELVRQFAGRPEVTWVGAADTTPTRRELADTRFTRTWNVRYCLELTGLSSTDADYRALLDRERPNLVIACPENARHGEVVVACLQAGAHVVTEKPMAARLAEAVAMAQAARVAGRRLVVNWPSTWSPGIRLAHRLVSQGAIGRLLHVRWRGGGRGPLAPAATHPGVTGGAEAMAPTAMGSTWWYNRADGGGALLDYACYGACLARWLVGEPAEAAFALAANLASPYGDVEDSVVVSVRFASALATLEATWATVDHGVPTGPIVIGTSATLVVERRAGQEDVVHLHRGGGQPPTSMRPEALPTGEDHLATALLAHLRDGTPLHETLTLDLNLDAQAILEAALLATASGKLEAVARPAWRLGRLPG